MSFKQGGAALSLPLNGSQSTPMPDMVMVTLAYVDPKQENKGRSDLRLDAEAREGRPAHGSRVLAKTKAKGLSRQANDKTKCDFAIAKMTRKRCREPFPARA